MADNSKADGKKKLAEDILGVAESASNAITDFYEGDSRGLYKKDSYGFVVPTPAWFPDSLVRSVSKSLYTKMLNSSMYRNQGAPTANGLELDFYNESSAGFFGSMWNSAVNSIISTAANQIASITSKVDSAVNTVASFFEDDKKVSIGDIIFNNSNIGTFIGEQPYVIVKGIHVQEYNSQTIKILQKVIPLMKNSYDKLTSTWNDKTSWSTKAKDVAKAAETAITKFIKAYYATNEKLQGITELKPLIKELMGDEYRLHGIADTILSEVTMGQYRMICKLPYIGIQSNMIQSTGENGWKSSVMTGSPIDAIGGMLGLNVAWNTPVTWSSANMEQFTPLKSSFTIFNDTFEHFITNYAFIVQFMSTTKAVTDFIFIRSPYLYDVEIPGGIRYQLCSCSASITPIGKTRKLFSDGKSDKIRGMMKEVFEVDLNPVAIQYVPDAYSVHLEFKSMLPDLWNFADSYVKDLVGRASQSGANYMTIGNGGYITGDKIGTKLTEFVEKLSSSLK